MSGNRWMASSLAGRLLRWNGQPQQGKCATTKGNSSHFLETEWLGGGKSDQKDERASTTKAKGMTNGQLALPIQGLIFDIKCRSDLLHLSLSDTMHAPDKTRDCSNFSRVHGPKRRKQFAPHETCTVLLGRTREKETLLCAHPNCRSGGAWHHHALSACKEDRRRDMEPVHACKLACFFTQPVTGEMMALAQEVTHQTEEQRKHESHQLFHRWTMDSGRNAETKRWDAACAALSVEAPSDCICVLDSGPVDDFSRKEKEDSNMPVVKCSREEEWPLPFLRSPQCFGSCEWSQSQSAQRQICCAQPNQLLSKNVHSIVHHASKKGAEGGPGEGDHRICG